MYEKHLPGEIQIFNRHRCLTKLFKVSVIAGFIPANGIIYKGGHKAGPFQCLNSYGSGFISNINLNGPAFSFVPFHGPSKSRYFIRIMLILPASSCNAV
jgi:hypothetical protein